MEKRYPLGSCAVVLAQGDITQEATDAVANAANTALLGGGGVDGAIHRAAGPELLAACRELKKNLTGGLLATGEAIATPGFRLRARRVIHCVGPIYDDAPAEAPPLLAGCYRRAIAFPAISTEAADVALRTIRDELLRHAAPGLVKVVLFDASAFGVFARAADRLL